MTLQNCPYCRGRATIRREPGDNGRPIHVYIQCEKCGRRTGYFYEGQEEKTSSGAKFAALAWNGMTAGG